MPELFIKFIDDGFCRIVYTLLNESSGNYNHYCFQHECDELVVFYRCTDDPDYCEPLRAIKVTGEVSVELPQGEDELSKLVRKYIEAHPLMTGFVKGEEHANK